MIKAIEIELQTENFTLDRGWENEAPTKYRARGTHDQNIHVFFTSWKIQLPSL